MVKPKRKRAIKRRPRGSVTVAVGLLTLYDGPDTPAIEALEASNNIAATLRTLIRNGQNATLPTEEGNVVAKAKEETFAMSAEEI